MIELAYFTAGWLCAISSVALGGWLVYRTKRESHEPFIGYRQSSDNAYNVVDPLEPEPEDETWKAEVAERTNTFVNQFAERLAGNKRTKDAA